MVRRRRERRDGKDKIIGVILTLVGLALLVGLGGGVYWLRKSKEPQDANNCPKSGARAIQVIMIDRSDPISPQQAQGVRQFVQRAKNEAAFATRFDVYTFEGDTKNEMRPIIQVCAPGRGEEANEWIENPERMRRRYEEFSVVLDQTIDGLLRENTQANSPIIESLRGAAITSFGPVSGNLPLRLILVSDMVQHTSLASHFKSEPNFDQLSKTSGWPSLRPTLKGAGVDILYLLRPSAKRGPTPIQNRGHQLFWEQLIRAGGGEVKSIQPI
jgi:hypothetical protein